MQSFAHKQFGDAEARLLFQIALHAVAQDRGLTRREFEIRIPPATEHGARRLAGVGSGGIDDLGLAFAQWRDLPDFLFQRHARQQVGDALVHCEIRGAIFGGCFPAWKALKFGLEMWRQSSTLE
jgi:hypothetical protein